MCGGLHIILPRQRAFCQSHSSNGSPDSKLIISYGGSSVSHSAVSSLTRLCNTLDCSPPGSSVHRILQARILKWVAIPFSRRFPNPGIKPGSLALQADALTSEPPGKPTDKEINIECRKKVIWFDQRQSSISSDIKLVLCLTVKRREK